jgi:acetate---CoA ligase (ADP-forming)
MNSTGSVSNDERWRKLMAPRRIALVGASDRNEYWAQTVHQAGAVAFEGDLVPVNPRQPVLSGACAVPNLAGAGPIDCAIVNVPAGAVNAVVDEGLRVGIKSFVVWSAGFKETGDHGAALQNQLERMCKDAGALLVGPNGLGLLSVAGPSPLYSADVGPRVKPGHVALISQTGSVVVSLLNNDRGICYSHLISTGNEAVTTLEDYLEYTLSDGVTNVVALVVETIRHPSRFIELVRRGRELGVPIVVLKLGVTDRGSQVSFSHTGALAGSAAVYQAVFRREGLIQVADLDELIEVLVVLNSGFRATGRRIALIGNSGGQLSLAVDLCEAIGLQPAAFGPIASARINRALGFDNDIASNPVDTGAGFAAGNTLRERYGECARAALDDPDSDIVAVIQDLQRCLPDSLFPDYHDAMTGVLDASKAGSAIAVINPTSSLFRAPLVSGLRRASGVPLLQGLREALSALKIVAEWHGRRSDQQADRDAPLAPVRGRWESAVATIQSTLANDVQIRLDEIDSKRLLLAYGVEVTTDRLATSADSAAKLAEEMGYPVACKAVSAGLPHKSDVGGVVLGVMSALDVRRAYEQIASAMTERMPSNQLQGVLVSKMVDGHAELILGVRYDVQFGPVMVLGLGGIYVEELDAAPATFLLPANRAEADAAAQSFVGSAIVAGARGRADATARFVETILAVAAMARDAGPELAELDVNPLILTADGRCVAVDAMAVLGSVRGHTDHSHA